MTRKSMQAASGPMRISWIGGGLLLPFSSLTLLFSGHTAEAACVLVAGIGNDTYVCDSGISPGLTDTSGDNTLTLPLGGTGQINGNVTFGNGADGIEIGSGTITGNVDQGGGADTFTITGGQVTGNVQQGNAIDDFRMTGGTIGSLSQGDGFDTFFMSGGRIVDFFEDGDNAVMTGGRIGRVNMKLDNNYFNMSDGIVDRNVVTGFGTDTIIISGGTIGGNISTSDGNDSVTVSGGSIGNGIKTGNGNDTFEWTGGIIYNTILLEAGNDTATLTDLTNGNMGGMTQLSGGTGGDALTLGNVSMDGIDRLVGWETIAATNDTELMFDGDLVLGDASTGTGTFSIDGTSTVFSGGADTAVSAFDAGDLATVINAGRIDLTNGSGGATDSFTVNGNYVGDDGLLFVDTVLGSDGSPSDRLIISGGTASGITGLEVENQGGLGGLTTQNGILVIQGINGADTGDGTFALTNNVAAGAYQYYLFKGGVSAGTGENWYLRSALVETPTPSEAAPAPSPLDPEEEPQPEAPEPEVSGPPPAPPAPPETPPDGSGIVEPPVTEGDAAPVAPPEPEAAEAPTPPTNPEEIPTEAPPLPVGIDPEPPTPGATRVAGDVVPLYRVEVPTYSAIAPAVRTATLSALGTLHERRGDQSFVDTSAAWTRVYGMKTEQTFSGMVGPALDGHLYGFQAGLDLIHLDRADGGRDIAGLFIGYSTYDADIKGQALGWNGVRAGDLDVNATSFGGYWTHVAASGWYVDAVLMGTWYGGNAASNRDVGVDIDGSGVTASLEGGYPIALTQEWTLEPQAQLIWQHLSLDDQADDFSDVSFDNDNILTARIGARLEGSYQTSAGLIRPHVKANLWHSFSGSDTVRFGSDAITTDTEWTSMELGAGVTWDVNTRLSAFASVDYTFNLGGENIDTWQGRAGLKLSF
jgi:autotransporter family porin